MEKTKVNHLQSSQKDKAIRTATIEDKTLNIETHEEQGSSSVEEKSSIKISWGERKTNDNEESLRFWLQTNMPNAEKKTRDTDDDPNLEEMTLCSVCCL
jgi:hypothetical protein